MKKDVINVVSIINVVTSNVVADDLPKALFLILSHVPTVLCKKLKAFSYHNFA
jgi:hypothetical protein